MLKDPFLYLLSASLCAALSLDKVVSLLSFEIELSGAGVSSTIIESISEIFNDS